MIRALLWKEWVDQRWKLAFGCVILMGFTGIGMHTRVVADEAILLGAVAMGTLLLPLLVGMGVVAADRGEGSLATLLALPVRASTVLATKLAVGWLACLVPLIGVGLTAWAVGEGREIGGRPMVWLLLLAAAASVLVLLWTVALGIRQTTEARAALGGGMFLAAGFGCVVLAQSSLAHYWLRMDWLPDVALVHPLVWVWPTFHGVWTGWGNEGVAAAAQAAWGVALFLVMLRRLGPAQGGRR